MKPSKKQGGFLTGFEYPTFACLQATLNPAINFNSDGLKTMRYSKKRMEYHVNPLRTLTKNTKKLNQQL